MKTFSELLESKYRSFIEEEDEWLFFGNLADYVDLFLKHPELESIVSRLNAERDGLIRECEQADAKANRTLLLNREKIKKIIAEHGIIDPQLDVIDDRIEMLIDGRMSTSVTPAEHTFRCLHDYCLRVQGIGHIELLKDFCFIQDNGYARTHFDDILDESRELRETLGRKRNDSVWGALNHLLIAREVAFDGQEKLKQFSKKASIMEGMNYSCYVREMKEIREGKHATEIQNYKYVAKDRFIFKRRDFTIYVNRVHHHLMSELMQLEKVGRSENSPKNSLEFEYDIEEAFEIWVKSEPTRRWQMKRNKEFTKGGKVLSELLQNAGEYILPNSQHEQTIRNLKASLVKGLNLRGDEVKGLFIRKNNFWGIEKSYLSR